MRNRIRDRLAALERSHARGAGRWRRAIIRDGETEADAIRAAYGVDQLSQGDNLIIRRIISPGRAPCAVV